MSIMAGMEFEDRFAPIEMDMQSVKILLGSVDNKVERARLDIQRAQGGNTRMIQALRDDMSEFRAEVQSRFIHMDQRFDSMDDRFTAMEDRFIAVDERFAAVDARFAEVDARFDQIDERFAAVDARFAAVDARFDQVDARFDAVESRLDRMDTRFDEVIDLIRGIAGSVAPAGA